MNPPQPTYYGRPVLKAPVWKWEIPAYLFTGGLAGASATLGLTARLAGNQALARSATLAAGAGAAVSPLLLIADLGRPERFLNMWRVAKPTSPMSMGTWLLTAFAPAAGAAATCELLGVAPRLGRLSEMIAGLLGPAMATYTGVLVADTAVPAWHLAHRELPAVFAATATASAAAAAVVLTPVGAAVPARRLLVAGALAAVGGSHRMEQRLGDVADCYHGPRATSAKTLLLAGAAIAGIGGRRRRCAAVVGGMVALGGAVLERFAVAEAGRRSAADPHHGVRAGTGRAPGQPDS